MTDKRFKNFLPPIPAISIFLCQSPLPERTAPPFSALYVLITLHYLLAWATARGTFEEHAQSHLACVYTIGADRRGTDRERDAFLRFERDRWASSCVCTETARKSAPSQILALGLSLRLLFSLPFRAKSSLPARAYLCAGEQRFRLSRR